MSSYDLCPMQGDLSLTSFQSSACLLYIDTLTIIAWFLVDCQGAGQSPL